MKEEKEQTVIDKTLLYLENYREMERYIKDAVSETSQVPDIGKYNISAEKAFLQSIRECKAETIILYKGHVIRGYSEGDRMRTQLTEKVVQGDDSAVVNQVIRCKSD